MLTALLLRTFSFSAHPRVPLEHAELVKHAIQVVGNKMDPAPGKWYLIGKGDKYCFNLKVGRCHDSENLALATDDVKIEVCKDAGLKFYSTNARTKDGRLLEISCKKAQQVILASIAPRLPAIDAGVKVDIKVSAGALAKYIEKSLQKGFKP